MSVDRKKGRGRRCLLGLGVGLLAGWGAVQAQTPHDPWLDFRFFEVPTARQIPQNPWVVRWLVRPDADRHCQEQVHKDGHAHEPQGCVYWQLAQGQCTVVTTTQTTHSVLGHLYLHCLTGR